jgi:cytochrome P450
MSLLTILKQCDRLLLAIALNILLHVYPEHHQFKPERFLEREFDSYEFFPFGGGKRRCIGEALAMLELKLVLATIVTEYNLELNNLVSLLLSFSS